MLTVHVKLNEYTGSSLWVTSYDGYRQCWPLRKMLCVSPNARIEPGEMLTLLIDAGEVAAIVSSRSGSGPCR